MSRSSPADRPIRAVIVDDEDLARSVLRELLLAHPDVEIAGECSNGFEAVKMVAEQSPDLVFLDIQMPKLNGFEVLELLDRKPGVIFVTAYDEFAVRAFEVNAVDYLLKPFSAERLSSAIARARRHINHPGRAALDRVASEARAQHVPLERILIRDGSHVQIVPVGTIDYIEAQDDYVCVMAGGKKMLKQQPLNELEKELDPQQFVRIHRSYILNIERLARIELYAKDSRAAILKDGARLLVSRAGYAKLKQLL